LKLTANLPLNNIMGHIAENIERVRAGLPEGVELVAVSKFHPINALREAYDAGQRVFGESRVQEISEKFDQMPDDVRWHFIGHLQTNKVKPLIGRVALIESVDSERLLSLIDRLSAERGVVTRVLMQVHVAAEETKTGFLPEELLEYFRLRKFEGLKATHLCGIMGMATNTDDKVRIKADFEAIAGLRKQILEIAPDLRGFDTVSMGMSDDYPLAIECGSTMVRVGTMIFGAREY
jgi:pyridoxal phosphate enzyme (YggS family)